MSATPSRRELANAIRALAMDAVQKAKSGHPGMPMGMADIAEVLWRDFLAHNPANTNWANRDRFILSNGHGSMLQYALLYLSGYDLGVEDLKQFRQLDSRTPGHPEYGYTPGVETTTGPLGQGLANGVGFAIAEKILAAQFNRDGMDIVDHYTYVFAGDGCLMEGISHEVCSLAGTLGLGKLIVFYDDNGISIDGEVHGWFTDDTPKRFEAYGWQVIRNVNGHDSDEITQAIKTARGNATQPTLICCKTIIGYGAPTKAGKEECHGAPLGDDEIRGAREKLGWTYPPFEVPANILSAWNARDVGNKQEAAWNKLFDQYHAKHPQLAAEFIRRMRGELPKDWNEKATAFIRDVAAKGETIATRKASQNALNGLGPLLPELIGGSADLAGSNLTLWKGSKGMERGAADANYIFYGVREFGMTAICNGISLHGGFIPYGATFLIFMEYARNAVRMAALMKQRNIQVYTHDSIGLGEDGPTHQPIEQLANLRLTPNMSVWRPADAVESAVAWKHAIERRNGPTALIFSRQNLPHIHRSEDAIDRISHGGYVLRPYDAAEPEAIIIATGSEVELALAAAKTLTEKGRRIRVVSMPSTDHFDAQDAAYRESVLPKACRARVAVEAGIKEYWRRYVGLDGAIVGMETFGESAPAGALYKHFGITADAVVAAVESVIG